MNKKTQLLLGLLVSGLFLWWSLSKADFSLLGKALGSVNYWYLIPFTAITLCTTWIRSWRWRLLLKPAAPKLQSKELMSPLWICFALNGAFPARAGEFARAWMVAKRHNLTFSGVFATVVVERIYDSVCLLAVILGVFAARDFSHVAGQTYDARSSFAPELLVAICAVAGLATLLLGGWLTRAKAAPGSPWRLRGFALTAAFAALFGFGAFYASRLQGAVEFGKIVSLDAATLTGMSEKLALIFGVALVGAFVMLLPAARRLAERVIMALPLVPTGPKAKVAQLLHAFSRGFDSLADWRLIVGIAFHTMLLWGVVAWTLQIMALGFPGMEHMSFLDGLALNFLIMLAIMIPAAPGYWGLYEVGCVLALRLLGITSDFELAFSYSLIIHAFQTLPIMAIGFAYAAKEHLRPSEIMEASENAEETALESEEQAIRDDADRT